MYEIIYFAMYKQFRYIAFLFILIAAGCSTTKETAKSSMFSFQLDGESYQIIGYTSEWGESANILVQLEDESPIFRAIDYDRNGRIDVIVYGDKTIEEANFAYRSGIQIALKKNLVQQERSKGEFEYKTDDFIFVVETFWEEDDYTNRFFIYYKNWNTAGLYRDIESNGILDRAEKGGIPLEEAQGYYEMVLEKAAEKNRLEEREDERFIIQRRSMALNMIPVAPAR